MNNKFNLFLIGGLLLCSLCIPKETFSRHIIGGHMSYECRGNNGATVSLEFSIEMIRESSSSGAFFDDAINLGVYYFENNQWNLLSVENTNLRNVTLLSDQLDPYIYQPNAFQYEKGTYNVYINVPTDQGPIMVAYQRCCRLEQSFTNVSGLDSLGTAISTIITPEGLNQCNNSARLEINGQRFLQLNTFSEKNFDIQDQDFGLDELSITFAPPILAGGLVGSSEAPGDPNACNGVQPAPESCLPPFAVMPFSPGYSFAQPFGLSSDITVDPQTGVLRGTPTETGLFQTALQIEEYRNGVLLSTSTFEYVFEVIEPIETAIIEVTAFYDLNLNQQKDSLEPFFGVGVGVKEPVLRHQQKFNGYYETFIDQPGTYTYFQTSQPEWQFHTPDDSIRITIDSLGATYPLDIPIVPYNDSVIAQAVLFASPPLCNDTQEVIIQLLNYSSDKLSGSLCFIPDSSTYFAGEPDSTAPFKIDYDNLYSARSFIFSLVMPNETNINRPIEHKLISIIDTLAPDTICSSANLLCAYDPNDKLAFPNRNSEAIFPGEGLQYMVRFQNTGNFPAKDVVISDTLDQNLDLSTLTITSSSHFYRLRQENNILHFRFLNIYLPDSTSNLEGSQGYISFRISPKAGLAPGTQIQNQAAIYFDRNPPIITNRVDRTLTERLINLPDQILVYPNPFRDEIFIDLDRYDLEPTEIEFYDIQGKYVGKYRLENDLNTVSVKSLSTGMYFYRITSIDGEELQTGKIVKQ